mmetsp:Transcript_35269/g.77043  ORF Transcript_35269/g.77043 Transcript_35269/m.77043 type:complete len:453 (+) Transcript_35269:967-2325(+)
MSTRSSSMRPPAPLRPPRTSTARFLASMKILLLYGFPLVATFLQGTPSLASRSNCVSYHWSSYEPISDFSTLHAPVTSGVSLVCRLEEEAPNRRRDIKPFLLGEEKVELVVPTCSPPSSSSETISSLILLPRRGEIASPEPCTFSSSSFFAADRDRRFRAPCWRSSISMSFLCLSASPTTRAACLPSASESSPESSSIVAAASISLSPVLSSSKYFFHDSSSGVSSVAAASVAAASVATEGSPPRASLGCGSGAASASQASCSGANVGTPFAAGALPTPGDLEGKPMGGGGARKPLSDGPARPPRAEGNCIGGGGAPCLLGTCVAEGSPAGALGAPPRAEGRAALPGKPSGAAGAADGNPTGFEAAPVGLGGAESNDGFDPTPAEGTGPGRAAGGGGAALPALGRALGGGGAVDDLALSAPPAGSDPSPGRPFGGGGAALGRPDGGGAIPHA